MPGEAEADDTRERLEGRLGGESMLEPFDLGTASNHDIRRLEDSMGVKNFDQTAQTKLKCDNLLI